MKKLPIDEIESDPSRRDAPRVEPVGTRLGSRAWTSERLTGATTPVAESAAPL